MDSMGVQTQADSEDHFYGTYEEILTKDELEQLENEFRPRLKNACYLDHSGATLYAKSQIDAFYSELQSSLFSNPHSRNPSSSITTDAIDYIRLRILHHFGTTGEDYSVIFTSGATSALKLVAESFRFNGGTFVYMEESHTSVVGMREVVGSIKAVDDQIKENKNIPVRGALGVEEEKVASDSTPKVYCLAKPTLEKLMDSKCGGCSACTRNRNSRPRYRYREGLGTLIERLSTSMRLSAPYPNSQECQVKVGLHRRDLGRSYDQDQPDPQQHQQPQQKPAQPNGLLVYPAQCNFSGYKYPLEWIEKAHKNHLDDINQIDQFYIQPEAIADLRGKRGCTCEDQGEMEKVDEEMDGDLKKAQLELNFQSELNYSSKLGYSPQEKLVREEKDGRVDAEESTPIKNGYNGNDNGMTSESKLRRKTGSILAEVGEGKAKGEELGLRNNRGGDEGREGKPPLNWYVLLDAASYVATNALDLSLYPADFVVCSFYKMFGFPTGLGALIVRNSVSSLLEKRYFGGGTVNIAIPSQSFHAKRQRLHEKFEDGTISFLSILALRHGLDTLKTLGRSMDNISTRAFRLAQYCYKGLVRMKYPNGQPVAVIYSDTKYESRSTQGPIVTFNLLRPDGTIIGYSEMEQIAYLHDVHMRYGCFCNVGACRRHLQLEPAELLKHYEAGHVCGDMNDLMDGKPTGAIRVSFGYMTAQKDVDIILRLIHTCWVHPFQNLSEENPVELFSKKGKVNKIEDDDNALRPKGTTGASHLGKGSPRKLSRIFVYPVKSCAPFQVSKMWAIGNRGLLYDREWLIMNSSGVPLTQKREPRLCQLKPNIDISNRRLVLSMEGYPDVSVPLEIKQVEKDGLGKKNTLTADLCTSKVCGDAVSTLDCGEEVNNWLSTVLNRPGLKLVRMTPEQLRKPRKALDEISLANFSQFLLLSMGSLRRLAEDLVDKKVDWAGLDTDFDSPTTPAEFPSTDSLNEADPDNPEQDPCEGIQQGQLRSQLQPVVPEKATVDRERNDERAKRGNGKACDINCNYGSDQNRDLLDQQLCPTPSRTRSSGVQSKGKEQVCRRVEEDGDDIGICSNRKTDDDTSPTQSAGFDLGFGFGKKVEANESEIRKWEGNGTHNSAIGFKSKVHQNQSPKEHLRITKIVEELIERFRANLVITDENDEKEEKDDSGGGRSSDGGARECFPLHPYEEESWDEIRIGMIPLKSGGPCIRCATICTDQKTGQRSAEPFLTLSAARQGQANFGIHLYQQRTGTEEESEKVSHSFEMRERSALSKSKNAWNGHGSRDKVESGVSWSKNESEGLEMPSLSASASSTATATPTLSASSPLALWTSSSPSRRTMSSSLSATSHVKIIRVGDLLYIDSTHRPQSAPGTDLNGHGVESTTSRRSSSRVEKQKNHHHLRANVPHRNANGNGNLPSATLENKKIIDSID